MKPNLKGIIAANLLLLVILILACNIQHRETALKTVLLDTVQTTIIRDTIVLDPRQPLSMLVNLHYKQVVNPYTIPCSRVIQYHENKRLIHKTVYYERMIDGYYSFRFFDYQRNRDLNFAIYDSNIFNRFKEGALFLIDYYQIYNEGDTKGGTCRYKLYIGNSPIMNVTDPCNSF